MSEIWTATRKEKTEQGTLIIFEVKDESTGKVRQEERYENALPLMMILGGYPPVMATVMLMKPLPWRFHKVGNHIYIREPDIGTEKGQQ